MSDIVVIGAGVIGLSSALRLQLAGHRVTIVARDFPTPFETATTQDLINYTSPWGGAHNRWVLPTNDAEEREHRMALATYAHMAATLRQHPESGVSFVKGIEYLETPSAEYRGLTEERAKEGGMEDFRLLKDGLPEGVTWGCEYKTWCVNPMVYCAFLLRRFSITGGKLLKMELRDPREIFAMKDFTAVKTVVNASGIGFGDAAMFPTRGQTCLVANSVPHTITRQNADGTWTFCVPRGFDGGTIIGGTKEPGDWDPAPKPGMRETLLAKFAATYPEIGPPGELRVLRDIVGRRPTRKGGMRLEREEEEAGAGCVIHAYGVGGRGYELSWGVSEAVLALVK